MAFLDRDGVINKEINYLHKIEDFEYTENCVQGMKGLMALGYKLVIVTNQAGIAKRIFSEDALSRLTTWLLNDLRGNGVDVLAHYHCPHHPDGVNPKYAIPCSCRKPGPGMILQAQRDYGVDLSESILIGDKLSDIRAASSATIGRSFLVRSGHSLPSSAESVAPVFKNLFAVSEWLKTL